MVNILPNSFVGLLGDHEGFPIERLALSRSEYGSSGSVLGSIGHDGCIKLWSLDGDDAEASDTDDNVESNSDSSEENQISARADEKRAATSDSSADSYSDSDAPVATKRKQGKKKQLSAALQSR